MYKHIYDLIVVLQHIADTMAEINRTNPQREEDKPEMLTIKQASERFGISESSVRAWVRKGKLPDIRAGETGNGKIYINSETLKRFLNGESNS